MYLEDISFDSLYSRVCKLVLESGTTSYPRGQKTLEIKGVILTIKDPRSRLLQNKIRNISIPFAIAEWLWCIKGSNKLDMMEYYAPSYFKFSDDGLTLHGAYGPRISSELLKIVAILSEDPDSRRALIPVYSNRDIGVNSKDVPCTSSLQFMIRDGYLEMIVHMRSNDVYLGLPYDIFNFSMIQEYIASKLNVKLGKYTHMVNSLHIYEKHFDKTRTIGNNPLDQSVRMSEMPKENIDDEIETICLIEKAFRLGKGVDKFKVGPYFEWFAMELKKYKDKKRTNKPYSLNYK